MTAAACVGSGEWFRTLRFGHVPLHPPWMTPTSTISATHSASPVKPEAWGTILSAHCSSDRTATFSPAPSTTVSGAESLGLEANRGVEAGNGSRGDAEGADGGGPNVVGGRGGGKHPAVGVGEAEGVDRERRLWGAIPGPFGCLIWAICGSINCGFQDPGTRPRSEASSPWNQEVRGFQTLRKPKPSKSFTFTVANVVTPWESMVSAVRTS